MKTAGSVELHILCVGCSILCAAPNDFKICTVEMGQCHDKNVSCILISPKKHKNMQILSITMTITHRQFIEYYYIHYQIQPKTQIYI